MAGQGIQPTQALHALRATLALRIFAVVIAAFTLPVRENLPVDMAGWYALIVVPLFCLNLAGIVFAKSLASFLERHPSWLAVDLLITVGVIFTGGGWRSSYFEYTLTTVVIFTIFANRRGAYISCAFLALASICKNPLPQGDAVQIFDVTNWDMRLGASLFYVTAGLILGYFSTIVERLNKLSEERIVEAREHGAIKQKLDLAFDLHDRLKSKLSAVIMVAGMLAKNPQATFNVQAAKDVQRLWQWLHYFQAELDRLVRSLKDEKPRACFQNSPINLCDLAKEESRILSTMTGFHWSVSSPREPILVPQTLRPVLCAFISEALTNSWKHSGVNEGRVDLSCRDSQIRMAVTDGGRGFELNGVDKHNASGLTSLARRCEELRGRLDITTSPGQGCCCALTFTVRPAPGQTGPGQTNPAAREPESGNIGNSQ
jgi:signal transduction histidine kinase